MGYKHFIKMLVVVFLFSYISPSFVQAYSFEEGNNIDSSNVLSTNDINDIVDTESNIDSKTDNILVESSIITEDVEVENETLLDVEEQEIISYVMIEDDETGELFEFNFDIDILEIDGEEFKAIFTNLDTGEQFDVDTAQIQASWYPLVIIAIHVARHGVKWAIKKHGKSAVQKATKKYGNKATGKTLSKIKFSSKKKLDEHWKKHKKEFPGLTKEGYLKRAQSLVGSTSKNVLSKKKKDGSGDIVKFNTKTGEFVSVTKNDVIKTFFKPKYGQKDWKKKAREYYNKQ